MASWNFVRTKSFNFTSASRRRANEVLTVLLPVVWGGTSEDEGREERRNGRMGGKMEERRRLERERGREG